MDNDVSQNPSETPHLRLSFKPTVENEVVKAPWSEKSQWNNHGPVRNGPMIKETSLRDRPICHFNDCGRKSGINTHIYLFQTSIFCIYVKFPVGKAVNFTKRSHQQISNGFSNVFYAVLAESTMITYHISFIEVSFVTSYSLGWSQGVLLYPRTTPGVLLDCPSDDYTFSHNHGERGKWP